MGCPGTWMSRMVDMESDVATILTCSACGEKMVQIGYRAFPAVDYYPPGTSDQDALRMALAERTLGVVW